MFEVKPIISDTWTQDPIVVVDADEVQCEELCAILEREHFPTTPLHSLANLALEIQEGASHVVILDLDTLPVDNRFFKDLKRTDPGVCIIGLSSRSFHPVYIHACLGKPVDEEELVFWVKSICENDADSRDPPET
jgi:DNA-binding NtrC family response regulator